MDPVLKNIQVLAFSDLTNYENEICRLHPGASISIEGILVESEGSGQAVEIKASSIRVLGFADPMDYPLGKTAHQF